MSTPVGSSQWMYTPASGFYPYLIDQSLRYNSADTLAMKRTPSSAGNRQTWSVSIWLKRGKLGVSQQQLLEAGSSGGYSSRLFWYFDSNDKLVLSSGTVNYSGGNQVFRDVGAWYHILIRCTGGSVTHYVNGLLDKTQALAGDTAINSTVQHGFGTRGASGAGDEFDGYLAQYALFDGTAYTFADVTETINGIVVPKDLSALSYGTNGFLLDFANSGAVGTDAVGSNDMDTVSGFAASDVVPDSPTNNFATINNIYRGSNTNTAAYGLTSEGNLKFSYSSNSDAGTLCTHPFSSGKYYWELRIVAGGGSSAYQHGTGIANVGAGYRKITNIMDGRDPNEIGMNSYTGAVRQGSSTVINTLSTTNMPNGAIIGCAVDADNGAIYWSYNGTFMNSSDPTSGASKTNAHATWTPADGDMWVPTIAAGGGSVPVNVINFGQDSTFAGGTTAGGNSDENGVGNFKYAPPSGFLALASSSLPETAIGPNSTTTSDQHFNTVLYTGNASTNAITGVGFSPNFVWIKNRSATQAHNAFDTVRGAGELLYPNLTNAEYTSSIHLTSFDSDGFTLGSATSANGSGNSIVAWNWKAGGTAVSNTDGSITSQVSAAPEAGFSIVGFTSTGNTETVGHGLSQAPELYIRKSRTNAENWVNFFTVVDGTLDFMNFNTTNASSGSGAALPTSTVFSIGGGETNGETHVAYCFHSVEGFSKVGSMELNNNADGTFVYLGFRPALVIAKRIDGIGDWNIFDSTRDAFNDGDLDLLQANTTTAESSFAASPIDLLSNGFKLRHTSANGYVNTATDTAIYIAFAEAPFKYANAR